ncbi:hypothetical protein Tco_1185945 [Tanacetum coccineum]
MQCAPGWGGVDAPPEVQRGMRKGPKDVIVRKSISHRGRVSGSESLAIWIRFQWPDDRPKSSQAPMLPPWGLKVLKNLSSEAWERFKELLGEILLKFAAAVKIFSTRNPNEAITTASDFLHTEPPYPTPLYDVNEPLTRGNRGDPRIRCYRAPKTSTANHRYPKTQIGYPVSSPISPEPSSAQVNNSPLSKESSRETKLPYPSRVEREKKDSNDKVQIQKFWEMFKKIHVDITLADALILMPKYQKMLKSLLTNKDKLIEIAKTPMNANCSAVILKKLPEKLGDPETISSYLVVVWGV